MVKVFVKVFVKFEVVGFFHSTSQLSCALVLSPQATALGGPALELAFCSRLYVASPSRASEMLIAPSMHKGNASSVASAG